MNLALISFFALANHQAGWTAFPWHVSCVLSLPFLCCHLSLVLSSKFLVQDQLLSSCPHYLPLSPRPYCVPSSHLSGPSFRSSALLFRPVSNTCDKELRVVEMVIKWLDLSSCVPVFCILPSFRVSSAVESINCFLCCLKLSMVCLPDFRHFTREDGGYCWYCYCCNGKNQHLSRVPTGLSNPF